MCVSCTENEIFFLKGDRNIIRLSTTPEGPASIGLYLLGIALCQSGRQLNRAEHRVPRLDPDTA